MAISLSMVLQSCTMVFIADSQKKPHTPEEIRTEPLVTTGDIACVNVSPCGTYTVDPSGCVGSAYKASYDCVLLAGMYGHGSSTWNQEYEEWLNGDGNESPEKFNDIDGAAYHDSVRAAEDAARL